jgi:hypothetical protein
MPALRQIQGGGVILHDQRQHRRPFRHPGIIAGGRGLPVVAQRHVELIALARQFRQPTVDTSNQREGWAAAPVESRIPVRRRLRVYHGRAAAQQQAAQPNTFKRNLFIAGYIYHSVSAVG